MKMLTYQGGYSIAVYDELREKRDLEKIHGLIADDRANFVAPANYEEDSQLEIIIKWNTLVHRASTAGKLAGSCEPPLGVWRSAVSYQLRVAS